MTSAHGAIDGLSAEVRRDALLALAADPAVERISLDAPVRANANLTPKKNSTVMSVLRGTLGIATTAYTGAGVGVAVIDSGIQPIADFDMRVVHFRDFTKDDTPMATLQPPTMTTAMAHMSPA